MYFMSLGNVYQANYKEVELDDTVEDAKSMLFMNFNTKLYRQLTF